MKFWSLKRKIAFSNKNVLNNLCFIYNFEKYIYFLSVQDFFYYDFM